MLAVIGALLLLTTTQSVAFNTKYVPYEAAACLTIKDIALSIEQSADSNIVAFDTGTVNGKSVWSVTFSAETMTTLIRADFDSVTNCYVGKQDLSKVEFDLMKTGI